MCKLSNLDVPRRRHSHGWGFTLLELLIVIAIISVLASVLLPALSRARAAAGKASCIENLKHVGIVLKMYASESNEERWPMKSQAVDTFMFDIRSVYPEYLLELKVFFCPSDTDNLWDDFIGEDGEGWISANGAPNFDQIDGTELADTTTTYTPLPEGAASSDLSYRYLGWAIPRNDWLEPVGALQLAYAATMASGKVDEDFTAVHPGNDKIPPGTELTLFRLQEGIARFFITDINNPATDNQAQSELAVMWDAVGTAAKPFSHIPLGSNVLYLDGHVEFIKYTSFGDVFPVTQATADFTGLGSGAEF